MTAGRLDVASVAKAGRTLDKNKRIVERGYDELAETYARARTDPGRRDAKYLALLLRRLRPGSRVMDLGCGSGVPITKALAERCDVIGVDFSAKQIRLARRLVPRAAFRKADMTETSFPKESFDAICSFHAMIHVPREEHRALFRRLHRWLKPGGLLVVTLGADDWVSSEGERFLGVPMFWSQFGPKESKRIVEDSGFTILKSSIEGEEFQGEFERHLYVLARKVSSR